MTRGLLFLNVKQSYGSSYESTFVFQDQLHSQCLRRYLLVDPRLLLGVHPSHVFMHHRIHPLPPFPPVTPLRGVGVPRQPPAGLVVILVMTGEPRGATVVGVTPLVAVPVGVVVIVVGLGIGEGVVAQARIDGGGDPAVPVLMVKRGRFLMWADMGGGLRTQNVPVEKFSSPYPPPPKRRIKIKRVLTTS
jgi:hypothetical protein